MAIIYTTDTEMTALIRTELAHTLREQGMASDELTNLFTSIFIENIEPAINALRGAPKPREEAEMPLFTLIVAETKEYRFERRAETRQAAIDMLNKELDEGIVDVMRGGDYMEGNGDVAVVYAEWGGSLSGDQYGKRIPRDMSESDIVALLESWGVPQEPYLNDLVDYAHNHVMDVGAVVAMVIKERGLWFPPSNHTSAE